MQLWKVKASAVCFSRDSRLIQGTIRRLEGEARRASEYSIAVTKLTHAVTTKGCSAPPDLWINSIGAQKAPDGQRAARQRHLVLINPPYPGYRNRNKASQPCGLR